MGFTIYKAKHDLINALKSIPSNLRTIISIDGIDGVGKTTLSIEISDKLDFTHIELDGFVQKNMGGYVRYIEYDKLLNRIENSKPAVVEGICVKQILNKIKMVPDVTVYIRTIDRYGFCDGQLKYFPADKSADEIIQERKNKRFSVDFEEDIIRYHEIYKPHENADYIFERHV